METKRLRNLSIFSSVGFTSKLALAALFFSIMFLGSVLGLNYYLLKNPIQRHYEMIAEVFSNVIIDDVLGYYPSNQYPEEFKEKLPLQNSDYASHVWYEVRFYGDGVVLTSPKNRNIEDNHVFIQDDAPLAVLDGWYDTFHPIISEDGQHIGELHLALSVEETLTDARVITLSNLLLATIEITMGGLLALFLGYRIVFNIQELGRVSKLIENGEYGVQLEGVNIHSKDDFGQTFRAFNTMSQKLRESMRALQEFQNLFSSLFESSKDAQMLLDENFNVFQANSACLDFCAFDKIEDMIGQHFNIFNVEDPESLIIQSFDRAHSDSELLAEHPPFTAYTKSRGKVSVRILTTTANVDGKSSYRVILHDITEYHDHAIRVENSEMRMRAIIATAIDAIFILDQSGGISEFNAAAEQLFGCDEKLFQHDFADLFIPSGLKDHFSYIVSFYYSRVRENGGTYQGDNTGSCNLMTMQDIKGNKFPVEITMTSFMQNDNLYLILFIRDITARIESESMLLEARYNAEQANRAKTRFLATVSHEIRTPLGGIIGILELIDDKLEEPDGKELLVHAQQNAQNLLMILNDLIDWSQADQNKLSIHPVVFDIKDLLLSTKRLMEPLLEQKRLKLLFEFTGDLPSMLVGDAGRIRQILLNLLSNAVKFTEKGHVKLRANLSPSENNDYICVDIAVEDTGMGIPKDEQEYLFKDFVRSSNSYKRNIRGAGLGLAISQKLLGLMDSEIQLISEVGEGSTFYFSLKLKKAEEIDDTTTEEQIYTNLVGGDKDVLIAEDAETNQLILQKQLSDAGYQCYLANDGQEALDQSMERKFDIILMDIAMPKLTGMQACQAIRADNNNLNQYTPIIGISAHMGQNEKAKCLDAGMNEFLTKPVQRNKLLKVVMDYTTDADIPKTTKDIVIQKDESHQSKLPAWLLELPVKISIKNLEHLFGEVEADFIGRLFKRFTEDSGIFLMEMKNVNAENLTSKSMRRAAHSLKGASYSLGLDEIGDLAKNCEEATKEGDLAKFKENLDEIRIQHTKLMEYMAEN